MTLNFSNLAARLRAGETASPSDLHDVLTASPAATFALMDLAAELRATHFGSTITATNLLGAPVRQVASSLVEVAAPLAADALAATLADLAADPAVERIDVDFVGIPALAPMEALRVLAAARLAAPVKSLHLGESREMTLRSLQPLAVGALDSLVLTVDPAQPRLIFEDLKLIVGAGLTIADTGDRDLVAEYVEHLRAAGVEDADAYAQVALEGAASGSGCGGNCACGSGGCGA
ncbi:hypothetical protein [Rothia nasimurium]|uniref:hypothetical protein n=1 Tax=Rothia nasimurium TaxID=85336 RepID=UPI002DD67CFC|nr:hypothetical protein [Rothia nasimurium]